jgi:hypothetical protein
VRAIRGVRLCGCVIGRPDEATCCNLECASVWALFGGPTLGPLFGLISGPKSVPQLAQNWTGFSFPALFDFLGPSRWFRVVILDAPGPSKTLGRPESCHHLHPVAGSSRRFFMKPSFRSLFFAHQGAFWAALGSKIVFNNDLEPLSGFLLVDSLPCTHSEGQKVATTCHFLAFRICLYLVRFGAFSGWAECQDGQT